MRTEQTKIFLVLFALLFLSGIAKAQRLVYDPVSDANLKALEMTIQANQAAQMGELTSTTAQTAATASSVANTLTILRNMENFLMKVNAVLTTTIYVKNIIARQKEILRMQKELSNAVQTMKNITPEELLIWNTNILIAVRTTEQFIILANDLLTGSVFRMDDNARMSQFFSIDKQLAIQQSIMKAYYVQYSIINEERAVLNSLRK